MIKKLTAVLCAVLTVQMFHAGTIPAFADSSFFADDVSDTSSVYEDSASAAALSSEDESISEDPAASGTVINVTSKNYGADGSDSSDDYAAIEKALDDARKACTGSRIEVYIPAGKYYISDELHIFSGTWLHLDSNAVIVRTDASKYMLLGKHLDENGNLCGDSSCRHSGYMQLNNVKISGGTWDGNISSKNLTEDVDGGGIYDLRHCSDIVICDTTIENDCAGHMVNIDGVSGLTVTNVKFLNQERYTGPDLLYYFGFAEGHTFDERAENCYYAKEALHIDFVIPGFATAAYPIEKTPCSNITVTDCTFDNCISGVGTHNETSGLYTNNVVIKNNTFKNMKDRCINAYNYVNLDVENNTAQDVDAFICVVGAAGKDAAGNSCSNTIANNTVVIKQNMDALIDKDTGKPECTNAISIYENSVVLIMNNSISNSSYSAIRAADTSGTTTTKVAIIGNVINKAGVFIYASAVSIGKGCLAEVSLNNVTSDSESDSKRSDNGIQVIGAIAGCTIYRNTVKGGVNGIEVSGTDSVLISNNMARGSKTYGVHVSSVKGAKIIENVATGSADRGIVVSYSSGFELKNNVAQNNKNNLVLYQVSDIAASGNITTDGTSVSDSGISVITIPYANGDMDGSGEVSVNDLQIAAKSIVNTYMPTAAESYLGDTDDDGQLSVADLQKIALIIIGKVS